MTQFSELGLSDKVLAAVEAAGYKEPTPIQAQAIPHVLTRRDVVGIAQTGTGKTASFTLPMLSILERGRARTRMPRTLILEPTRELAAQVEENFNKYGINHRLTVALLIGGVSFDEQDRKLTRGADVLIATPGRLLDHFERGKLLLNGVEILVIDEADRMLDMGFIPDIERISKLITAQHQTLFFSATMAPEIKKLADTFLTNPVQVAVAPPSTTVKTVTQGLVSAGRESHEKRETLRGLIRNAVDLKNAIVFCNRKRDVATLHRSLARHGFNVGALHGDMDQRARMATLDDFRHGKITLLVASDVAARGLDIPDVSHVFNFDVPTHAEDYVHRIGRTGRAGRSGTALTLVTPADTKYLASIEKLIGEKIPGTERVAPAAAETGEADHSPRSARRGRGGNGRREARPRAEARSREPAETARREPAAERPAPQQARASDRRREERPRSDAPRPDRSRSSERPARDRREDRRERDAPAAGLGDHVPAFLLRPVRIARPAGE